MSEATAILAGVGLGECPRWHGGRLWFSDWVAGEVVAVEESGAREVMLTGLSMPFSFDWTPEGGLMVVSGPEKRLLRRASDGALERFADLSAVCDRPWNEIVVDGRGNAYLNSIGFDMMAGEERRAGVVALMTPDGTVRKVADGLGFPNGMVVTPDNSTLIVAESYRERLTAFRIAADGSLSAGRIWADLPGCAPDGICIDTEGCVWYADVPNRRTVRVREGGEVLETVNVDRGCFACMLGGADGKSLFIVAADWRGPASVGDGGPTGQVLVARASLPHAGWP